MAAFNMLIHGLAGFILLATVSEAMADPSFAPSFEYELQPLGIYSTVSLENLVAPRIEAEQPSAQFRDEGKWTSAPSLITQSGESQLALLLQAGDQNLAVQYQAGAFNVASINQTGDLSVGIISQTGYRNNAELSQAGVGQSAIITQQGAGNVAILQQR